MEWVFLVLKALLLLFITAVFVKLFAEDPLPASGVYSPSGNWQVIKYWAAYIFVTLRKWRSRVLARSAVDNATFGLGGAPGRLEDEPRALLNKEHAIDSAYFCAFDSKGNWFILRIARRKNREAELWLTINLEGDGVFESPVHPGTVIVNTNDSNFSAGDLSFTCLEGFRRWKISFNGLLRKGIRVNTTPLDTAVEETSHIRFTFIWEALTDLYNSDSDIAAHCIASALSKENWSAQYFEHLKDVHQTRYGQVGGMMGTVSVDGREKRRLQLRSFRDRSFGVRHWSSFRRYVAHMIALEDGSFIELAVISFPGCFSNLVSGCLFKPNSERFPISWTDLSLADLGESGKIPQKYAFSFKAGGYHYKVRVIVRESPVYFHGRDWSSKCHESIIDVICNSYSGRGVAEFFYRSDEECSVQYGTSLPLLQETVLERSGDGPLVVAFDQPSCTDSSLVGGKGSQLGLLTKIQKDEGFVVPYGICLTALAFKAQTADNQVLTDGIQLLEETACGKVDGNLHDACNATVELIKTSEVKKEIQLLVAEALIKAFKQESRQKLFAVRSSAVGEDGDEISAAGQMDTILGVRGDPQSVMAAVRQCWASQLTFQAVEYKRQHGQPISTGMGVVIQELVQSETAGVLFTRDAITGDPSIMTLNANYGLGESVVSGISDPDTILVAKSSCGKLTIKNKSIGTKKVQINAKAGGGGTETVSVGNIAAKCCISDDVILHLCSIGIKLEQHFGTARDIEWAMYKDTIYLLQARPVTTLDQEDDEEIIREFDSPHAKEDEFCTTANVGEMLPGALTPLTISTVLRALDYGLQSFFTYSGLQTTRHSLMGFKCSSAHGFLNLHAVEVCHRGRNIMNDRRMTEVGLIGQKIELMTDDEVLSYNQPLSFPWPVYHMIQCIYVFWTARSKLKVWENVLETYSVSKSQAAEAIYADINRCMPDLYEVWARGIVSSASSGTGSAVLMAVLTRGDMNYTQEHYSDIALLLTSCEGVFSATVPVLLKDIARQVRKQGDGDFFSGLSVQEATQWLQSDKGGVAGTLLKEFLTIHGHRCVRESELREKSWAEDPAKVVSTIQSMAARSQPEERVKDSESIDNLIAKIKSPLTPIGRFLLRFLIPKAQAAVGLREWGKSLQVKMNDKFKQAYWKLAATLRKEGRLPEEDLMFFLTHHEIALLLRTKSAKLIIKAQKRRKLYAHQAALSFHRDNIGHPIAIPTREQSRGQTVLQLTGMPVSLGMARGYARVVTNLDEAVKIQVGEVLIVPFTDVGWSPYFPLITGLVTEIGGLMSHGAVVAREYGIPCIVNCQQVTTVFSTGDFVELHGNTGIIRKIQVKPQEITSH